MILVPRGWDSRSLREIAPEVKGSLDLSPGREYELWSVPSFADGHPERVDGASVGSAKRPVEPGDVLLCKINPRINRVWKVGHQRGVPQVASLEWIALRPATRGIVNADYLRLYLSAPHFRDWITAAVSGVTGSHTRAKPPQVMQQEVAFPNIDEQRRIVDILEDHLSRLEAARATMISIPPRVVAIEESWLRQLDRPPAGECRPLGSVLVECRGGWSRSTRHLVGPTDGRPYLKMNNITRRGRLDLSHLAYVRANPNALARFELRIGDMLFNSKNSGDLIGKTAVVDQRAAGATFNENIMRLRFAEDVMPEFAGLWFLGPQMRRHIRAATSASTNVAAVYRNELLRMPFWHPALERQRFLVNQFNGIRDMTYRGRKTTAVAEARGTLLRAAILEAAFSGRLTGRRTDVEQIEEIAADA